MPLRHMQQAVKLSSQLGRHGQKPCKPRRLPTLAVGHAGVLGQ